jgi:hypothetical protein
MTDAPKKTDPLLREPPDFSLVLGGPLYQLYLRTRMAAPPLDRLDRRMIVIPAIVWLPLFLLSLVEGTATGGGVRLPFLHDIALHAKYLLALPLLILAELVVHQRIRPVVRQFVDRGVIRPEQLPQFHDTIASAMRLRNSVALEVFLIVFVYTVGHYIWLERVVLQTTTWYGSPTGATLRLSSPGYWYAYVSAPIMQFILLRWYFRLFVWGRFLWQVSRLDLHLVPTHPDRAGGLGFLGTGLYAFTPLLVAQGVMVAGMIAERIFYEGATLTSFQQEIVGAVVFCLLIVIGPLCVFTPHLLDLKKSGLREYGGLASRYVREFDQKWVRGGAPADEALVGSGDIQSLADLANSFDVVRTLRPVPFTKEVVIALALATVAPVLPLTLTMIPLEELIKKILGALF